MTDEKISRRNSIIFKSGLFLAAMVLLLLFLPKESENHYTYEMNRPWTYSLLTAPFDIPVKLDSVSAKAVRDSIDRVFEPVYKRDLTIERTMVADYARRLSSTAGLDLTQNERNRLLSEVKKIYDNTMEIFHAITK